MRFLKKIALIILITLIGGVIAFFALSQKTDNSTDTEVERSQQTSSEESSKQMAEATRKQQSSEPSEEIKKDPPVKMKKTTLSLGAGENYTLSTTQKAIKWESSDKNILTVDEKGKVTAKNVGKATVKAYDKDNNSAECTVTVKESPEWVSLKEYELTLGVGENYKLSAVLPEGSAAASRKFDSSDGEIIKMTKTDWEGQFTALKAGSAYVHVKLYNGQEAYCNVTVKAAPKKVDISSKTLTLGAGDKTELRYTLPKDTAAGNITVKSSDGKIVKVTRDGDKLSVSAEKEGTANVSVKTYNGKEAVCKITVKKAPEFVSLVKNEIELKVGQKYTLGSKVSDGAAALERNYSCSNDYVLKMTKTKWEAVFEAIAAGEAWVSVETYNGMQDYCHVIVAEKENSAKGNSNGSNNNSNNGNSENQNNNSQWNGTPTGGHVTAPDGTPWTDNSGRTMVYTTYDSIRLTNNTAVLRQGNKYNIDADSRADNELSYSSSDGSVAKVDQYGTVTAVKSGTANIIITTPEGISDKLEVIVLSDSTSLSYPNVGDTDSILNSASLSPMMTNYGEVDDMVGSIISQVTNDSMSPAQKVRACYDYLVKNCTYGYSGYKAITVSDYLSDEDEEIVEFAYSILKDHVGTCENFSAALTVIMRRLGFEANTAYGDVAMLSGGFDGHYWTDVEIGGKHYIFDAQVENNAMDGDNIHYRYYGMKPELNNNVYRYSYTTRVHGFYRG